MNAIQTILKNKYRYNQQNETSRGIDIYEAVIDHGVETFENFKQWKHNRKNAGISLWGSWK